MPGARKGHHLPRYPVESYRTEVSDVSGGSRMIYNGCIDMEQAAYDQLPDDWSGLPAQARHYCDEVARILVAVRSRGNGAAGPLLSAAAILGVSIYGGYFNGGLGIMLLAALGLIGFTNLHGMNGSRTCCLGLRPYTRRRDYDRRLSGRLAGATHPAHRPIAHRHLAVGAAMTIVFFVL